MTINHLLRLTQRAWRDQLDHKTGFGIGGTRESQPVEAHIATTDTATTGQRSWIDPEHWLLGDPEQVIWIAAFVFFVSYRVFRFQDPHHRIGCVVSIIAASVMFMLLVANGFVHNSAHVLTMVLNVAAFGYVSGTVVTWLIVGHSLWMEVRQQRTVEQIPPPSTAMILAKIRNELEEQLSEIEKADIDQATLKDLKQAARDKAEEQMAIVIEGKPYMEERDGTSA